MNTALQDKVANLPTGPGVYQHKDGNDVVIYVGKAKNLRNRVRSYFQERRPKDGRLRMMVDKIEDVEVIVTDTEAEALILENNLIKQLRPRYNINLRDDKTFPYICIKNEPFPRIFPTRRVVKDGSTYIGPYADVGDMRLMLRAIRSIFQIRTCSLPLNPKSIAEGKFQTCLEYHIKKCAGPCVGLQTEEQYDETMRQVKQLLDGKTKGLVSLLRDEMQACADAMQFEEAGILRDRIRALERYSSKQKVVSLDHADRDLFALSVDQEQDAAVGVMFKVREGKILGRHQKYLRQIEGRTTEELMQAFVEAYYTEATFFPAEVFLSSDIVEYDALQEFLSDQVGRKVAIRTPERGQKAELMRMVEANANLVLGEFKMEIARAEESYIPHSVRSLKRDLRLPRLPRIIECFDISHLAGTGTVASCVVFKDGRPLKSSYRTYRIRSVEGKPDDFKSMREVVYRRYRNGPSEDANVPDLIVIDGGKGQLSSAVESLKKADVYGKVAVIGLAKRLEEVFVPGDTDPILIPKSSASLRLLQRVRDEAHRFAITFQRKQRGKKTLKSELLEVPGIGQKTVQRLLKRFGSVKKVRNATLEELKETIGQKTAEKIVAYLTGGA
ncbi:MAG: excinuclease ABC subunit UvrC [Rhodothermales bacterium]